MRIKAIQSPLCYVSPNFSGHNNVQDLRARKILEPCPTPASPFFEKLMPPIKNPSPTRCDLLVGTTSRQTSAHDNTPSSILQCASNTHLP